MQKGTDWRARILSFAMLLVGLYPLQPAVAQTGYSVTLVARVCSSYTDIMANRARNNIQESLRDLGPDSVYDSGEPVKPAIEDANDNCQPLAEPWKFTLGSFIAGQDAGDYGHLSYVGGVDGSATTVAQVPELDSDGKTTGRSIDWAVTIQLTQEQLQLSGNNSLWIQGGSPGDPLNGRSSAFGFGALRCAIDGLNGDNVESTGFPTGSKHVFCYAYYVNPPPTSGTIVVIKQQGSGDPATQSFDFRGNISYTQNGSGDNYFTLDVNNGASSQTTFYRAETGNGDQPWTVWETAIPGWSLASAACVSSTTESTIIPNPGLGLGGQEITLAAGDTVTCTYVNDVQVPASGLLVTKSTSDGDAGNAINAVGTFDFQVAGGSVSEPLQITTAHEGIPAFDQLLPGLPVGQQYTITEPTLPAAHPAGDWRLAGVTCLGQQPDSVDLGARTVLLTLNQPAACNFHNVLEYSATLSIRKVTTNGAGPVSFLVGRPLDPAFSLSGDVETTDSNSPSQPLVFNQLPYGTYNITESSVAASDWRLVDVTCNGQPVAHENGRAVVVLSRAQSSVECVFTNTRDSGGGSASIPTLGGWALAVLSTLLAFYGALSARRRSHPAA